MTLERDHLGEPHPLHRADTPYDWQTDDDYVIDDADRIAGPRVLFAAATFCTLMIGLTCAAVGFVLDHPGTTWTGAGLVAAGTLGLRVLWVGGKE